MDDGTKSLFIKLGLMLLTALAGYLHVNVPDQQLAAFSTDFVDAGLLVYGYYRSHRMKLVPKASVAVSEDQVVMSNNGTHAIITGAKADGGGTIARVVG